MSLCTCSKMTVSLSSTSNFVVKAFSCSFVSPQLSKLTWFAVGMSAKTIYSVSSVTLQYTFFGSVPIVKRTSLKLCKRKKVLSFNYHTTFHQVPHTHKSFTVFYGLVVYIEIGAKKLYFIF